MNKYDIAANMSEILNSDSTKSLFGKYAQDNSSMEKFPNTTLELAEQKEPLLMAKYPSVMQVLELMKAEEKFPVLMQRLKSGEFGDVSLADDTGGLLHEVDEVKKLLEAFDNEEISEEFFNMLRDMGLPADETLPIEDDLVVEEGLGDMGDLEVDDKMLDFAAADLAIDSLLTASAALDRMNLSNSSMLSLKMASMIVEAKKKTKDEKQLKKEKAEKEKKEKEKLKEKEKKEKEKALKEKEKEKSKSDKKNPFAKYQKEQKDKKDKDEDKSNGKKKTLKDKTAKELEYYFDIAETDKSGKGYEHHINTAYSLEEALDIQDEYKKKNRTTVIYKYLVDEYGNKKLDSKYDKDGNLDSTKSNKLDNTNSLVHMTLEELEDKHPDAFSALPEPYQADHCLDFYIDINGNVCASPKEDQVGVLGEWEAIFDNGKWI